MPMANKQILKLKLSTAGLANTNIPSDSPRSTPPQSATTPKIRLKFGSKTPAPPPILQNAQPSQASQRLVLKSKPLRLSNPKKRDHDVANRSAGNGSVSAPAAESVGPKRVKITHKGANKVPTTPALRVKMKGRPPPRPLGSGYDSEASDREIDPAIEMEFVLRMLPGDDCEYMRKAIEERRWGPRSQGGADIRLKFLRSDGRRATLTIRGTIYAAALVDLPCIVEGMKSWDRKGWYKAADICQMLLVLGPIKAEAEALEYALPAPEVDKTTFAYAHGLTPPMKWARKRRFRKRVSTRQIEYVEEEVARLFQEDAKHEGMTAEYSIVYPDRLSRDVRDEGGSSDGYGDADADADGVEETQAHRGAGTTGDDDTADIEAMFEDEDFGAETSVAGTPTATENQPTTDSTAPTPAPITSQQDSGDEESEEEEEEEEEDADVDDDAALEQQAHVQRKREEIADLEVAIKAQTADLAKLTNNILRNKKLAAIQSLKGDLELKKAAIGEGEDD